MKAENLAIVFTPCIFRTHKKEKAQDSLHCISKQTECITLLIDDQLHRLTNTLAEIDTLDTACHTASTRLSSLRSSRMFLAEEKNRGGPEDQYEEVILTNHIQSLQKEKALLTSDLPNLQPSQSQGSDDDHLSTTDVDDSAAGSLDDLHENSAQADSTTGSASEKATDTSGNSTKISTKSRVSTPIRRLTHAAEDQSVSSRGSSEDPRAGIDETTVLV